MSETQPTRNDKKIKFLFLVAFLVIAGVVYWHQRTPSEVRGWDEGNFDTVFEKAKMNNRKIVVFFAEQANTQTEREAWKRILRPDNVKALKEGNFLTLIVRIDDLAKAPLAQKYKVTGLPTLMIIKPDGTEQNRHDFKKSGMIGEVPFRQNFLRGQK